MVDNAGRDVDDTSGVQQDGTDDDANCVLGAVDCAVSSCCNPTVADEDTTAEVEVGGCAERYLVWEFSQSGGSASNDSSATEDIRDGCSKYFSSDYLVRSLDLCYLRVALATAARATSKKTKRNILSVWTDLTLPPTPVFISNPLSSQREKSTKTVA
jgi:hypothetical protein